MQEACAFGGSDGSRTTVPVSHSGHLQIVFWARLYGHEGCGHPTQDEPNKLVHNFFSYNKTFWHIFQCGVIVAKRTQCVTFGISSQSK